MKTLIAFLIGSFLLCGCATWQQSTGKSLVSVVITVDAAMKGWKVWVKEGLATPDDEARVKAAYQHYQSILDVTLQAYSAAVAIKDKQMAAQAVAALNNSSSNLVDLVRVFTQPKTQ